MNKHKYNAKQLAIILIGFINLILLLLTVIFWKNLDQALFNLILISIVALSILAVILEVLSKIKINKRTENKAKKPIK
jgi:hypothetical protein